MDTNMVLNLIYLEQGAQLVRGEFADGWGKSGERGSYVFLDTEAICKVGDLAVVSVRDTFSVVKVVEIADQEDCENVLGMRLKHVIALVDLDSYREKLAREARVLKKMRTSRLRREVNEMLQASGLESAQLGTMLIGKSDSEEVTE